jgi:hypothetical protein
VPINRLVELDNAWQALDAAHLDAAAQAQFTALQQRITATTLERGEQAQRFKRWSAEARQALVELQAIAREAAAGQQARALMDQARGTAQAALATAPDSPQATACANRWTRRCRPRWRWTSAWPCWKRCWRCPPMPQSRHRGSPGRYR